ncbi:LCP family protein [Anaerosalibacter massiliensis]|uniref:LCP family protein n=1 Tax=Anaerosalibacter massiliensis TaxID=1347392 RepID=A0A9X2MH50_9FIRM|nr:LCP family protein [Anaerosalibacter massiliensis]MCR2045037.1 LCP family protein [Anaerosalibacter massiliensis]
MGSRREKTNKKKMIKKRRFKRVLILIGIAVLASFAYVNAHLNNIKTVSISKKNEDLGIKDEEDGREVINIALFGGDSRKEGDVVHSDAIMVLSIDKAHKKVKLSSIMRDTYVDIHKHGKTKLNHAYAYGGPELAIRTINENFNLNIRDYAFVDFYSFEKLVDAVGGVDVDIKDMEVKEINRCIKEIAELKKTKPILIKNSGMNHLNGEQAVAYSRIRKVGGGDFERTERQRRVINELFEKGKNVDITKYPKILDSILPYVETSLSKTEIMKLGTYVLTNNIQSIEQNRFPTDEHSEGQFIGDIWYLVTDLDETEKEIHDFIYENMEESNIN